MGTGWTTRVWENLGWHYNVESPCGRIRVHPSYNSAFSGMATAFLGGKDESGGYYAESGKNPRLAVRNVLRVAKAHLAKIGARLEGL